MTVHKKPRPTYILLTIDEQLSLSLALFNLNLGSLAQNMRLLTLIGGAPQGKPGFYGGRGATDPMLLLTRLILPMFECLRRVDTVVERLDRELESFHRVFDMIQQRFDRIYGTMDRILQVMDMMSITSTRNAPTPRREETEASQTPARVCECGRPIPSGGGGQNTDETENANAKDADVQKAAPDDLSKL